MTAADRWIDRSGHIETTEGYALAAVERLAERLRELSVRTIGRSERRPGTHSVTTLAVSMAAVPRAIEHIDRMRAELTRVLDKDESRDAVYCLAISFFPITTPETLGLEQSGE